MADVLDPMANAMMKAICQGSRVRRNPETWNRGDQDGGDGHQGTVTWCDTAVGRASVLWDVTQVETTHDLSHDGRFELIVTGHEDRWLSAEDFGVGTRVVHDFRGPGVVTAKEKNQNGIPCTRVLFDNGESHAYKEAYFMQGKIVREEDAPKLQPAARQLNQLHFPQLRKKVLMTSLWLPPMRMRKRCQPKLQTNCGARAS